MLLLRPQELTLKKFQSSLLKSQHHATSGILQMKCNYYKIINYLITHNIITNNIETVNKGG